MTAHTLGVIGVIVGVLVASCLLTFLVRDIHFKRDP